METIGYGDQATALLICYSLAAPNQNLIHVEVKLAAHSFEMAYHRQFEYVPTLGQGSNRRDGPSMSANSLD